MLCCRCSIASALCLKSWLARCVSGVVNFVFCFWWSAFGLPVPVLSFCCSISHLLSFSFCCTVPVVLLCHFASLVQLCFLCYVILVCCTFTFMLLSCHPSILMTWLRLSGVFVICSSAVRRTRYAATVPRGVKIALCVLEVWLVMRRTSANQQKHR